MIYGEWLYNIMQNNPRLGWMIMIWLIALVVFGVWLVDWDERRRFNKRN